MDYPRHLLSLEEFSAEQITHLVELAEDLKQHPHKGTDALKGKTVGLVFQKPSVRTRISAEVAAFQLGGHSIYLAPENIQLGEREPVSDVARTMSRYVDGVYMRTFEHATLEEFAAHGTVPVINALSQSFHPCQALSDLLTVKEKFGSIKGRKFAYVGDGNNVLHSLLLAGSRLGMDLRAATPEGYQPSSKILDLARANAEASGGSVLWTSDPTEALRDAEIVYTDVWISMGDEEESDRRRRDFRGYQINEQLTQRAHPSFVFMHCLPAHRGEEVDNVIMEGPHSCVFDQAENRLHIQKAVFMTWLGNKE
ncbi:MAG: ornithine carbamoyltransferase [Candidatus Omnitrophica bacterium]|nr:ornithine carbamoyltransferase [Candidatus Omnitrophota bacterium]